jgi:hypothetical protein
MEHAICNAIGVTIVAGRESPTRRRRRKAKLDADSCDNVLHRLDEPCWTPITHESRRGLGERVVLLTIVHVRLRALDPLAAADNVPRPHVDFPCRHPCSVSLELPSRSPAATLVMVSGPPQAAARGPSARPFHRRRVEVLPRK